MNEEIVVRANHVKEELDRNGLSVLVELDGDTLVLTGTVDTDAERDAAVDIAAGFLGDDAQVEENIAVGGILPEETRDARLSQVEVAGTPGAEPDTSEDESMEPGDFTDRGQVTSYMEAQPDKLSDDPGLAGERPRVSEGDDVYVPPIDPTGGAPETIAGLQSSSLDSVDVEPSSDGRIGDEAIRDAVLRELSEDAATAGLEIEVEVEDAIVRLLGRVADLDDVEGAEEVAARVPGIIEVIEELEVEGLERR